MFFITNQKIMTLIRDMVSKENVPIKQQMIKRNILFGFIDFCVCRSISDQHKSPNFGPISAQFRPNFFSLYFTMTVNAFALFSFAGTHISIYKK